MAKQTIAIGSAPNDGTGDSLRVAGIKINENFEELYLSGYLRDWTSLDLNTGDAPVVNILGSAHGKLIGVTSAGALRESVDGLNWSAIIVASAGLPMAITVALGAIYPMGDGEVLVIAAAGTQLWKSTGWQANPSTATWAKVAEVADATKERFHQGWGVRVAGQYVYAAEYSGNDKPGAYNAYLSTNHGSTFTKAWDARDHLTLDSESNFHNHGVCIDPWFGETPRLWQINGDTPPQSIHYSDDLGTTWTKMPDSAYPGFTDSENGFFPGVYLVATATPGGIVIGMDDKPEGDVVIPRDKTYAADPQIVYTVRFPQDSQRMSYVAQAQARLGDWVFTLHNPSASVLASAFVPVPARITASNASSKSGAIVWEDVGGTLTNLRKIDLWNGALWVRNNANSQMIRIPLFQGEGTIESRPEFDRGNVLGGEVAAKIEAASAITRGATARHSETIVGGILTSSPGQRSITLGHFFDISTRAEVSGQQKVVVATGVSENGLNDDGYEGLVRSIGDRQVVIGYQPDVEGNNLVAIGERIYGRTGTGGALVGSQITSTDETGRPVGIGSEIIVNGQHSVGVGFDVEVTGTRGIGLGFQVEITGMDAIAVGRSTKALHTQSIALGRDAETTANFQMNIGGRYLQMDGFTTNRNTPPAGQIALYHRSDLSRLYVRHPGSAAESVLTVVGADFEAGKVTVGKGSAAGGFKAVAIGDGASASGSRSVAIGEGSTATNTSELSIGNRYITMQGFSTNRATPPADSLAIWFDTATDTIKTRNAAGTIKTLATV